MTNAGPHGVVFSIPSRRRVLAHPVHDLTVIAAINTMVPATRNVFRQGGASVSPELYWCRGGVYSILPTGLDGGEVRFEPPPEFSAVLTQLTVDQAG